MSHLLPPAGHPARELIDVRDVVEIGLGRYPGDRADALRSARRLFAASPAARAVHSYVVDSSTDEFQLIRIGRRGGWRVVWRFGPWNPPRRP